MSTVIAVNSTVLPLKPLDLSLPKLWKDQQLSAKRLPGTNSPFSSIFSQVISLNFSHLRVSSSLRAGRTRVVQVAGRGPN